jgi:CBS domain-containing protein
MKPDRTARDYMTGDVVAVTPDMDLRRAAFVLLNGSISGAPVIDAAGRVVGILTEKDCFRVVFEAGYHNEPCGPVSDYMSTGVETVDADSNIIEVLERFLGSRYRRFPVVSAGRLVGVISRRDALRALADMWTPAG